MRAAVTFIAAHPGCTKSDAARAGDTGPLYSGSVESLIRGGYVRAEQDHPGSHYRLYLTETGEEFAAVVASA
jgi:hypothetical protein